MRTRDTRTSFRRRCRTATSCSRSGAGRSISALLPSGAATWRPATRGGDAGRAPRLRGRTATCSSVTRPPTCASRRWTPSRPTPVRPETTVLENVNWIPGTERSWFAVSANGTAVSVPGNPDNRHLVWVDRQGQVTEIGGDPEQTTHAALSRDGRRVVLQRPEIRSGCVISSPAPRRVSSRTRGRGPAGGYPVTNVLSSARTRPATGICIRVRSSGGALTPLLTRPRTQHRFAVAPATGRSSSSTTASRPGTT